MSTEKIDFLVTMMYNSRILEEDIRGLRMVIIVMMPAVFIAISALFCSIIAIATYFLVDLEIKLFNISNKFDELNLILIDAIQKLKRVNEKD